MLSTTVDSKAEGPESGHGGDYLRELRLQAGLTTEQVAARACMRASELEEIESVGTQNLSYKQITSLVRATQPPRPSWWDEGHEHDLSLVDAHLAPRSEAEAKYWARVGNVRNVVALQRSRRADQDKPPE